MKKDQTSTAAQIPFSLQPGFYCLMIFSFWFSSVFSQELRPERRYLQASNCNCSLLTPTDLNRIQWFGSCDNGFCDGYGTVFYYDQNGDYAGKFIGSVSQGLLNGFGTRYYPDGTIVYQGKFRNNNYVDVEPYTYLNGIIGDFIIDSLLSGGIHRHCEVVSSVFSENDVLQEIRYRVSCDGQWETSNHYTCTLVFSNREPYVHIVDANDNAQVFITLNFIRYGERLYDWFERQSQNSR
jgi:hypothetical protein